MNNNFLRKLCTVFFQLIHFICILYIQIAIAILISLGASTTTPSESRGPQRPLSVNLGYLNGRSWRTNNIHNLSRTETTLKGFGQQRTGLGQTVLQQPGSSSSGLGQRSMILEIAKVSSSWRTSINFDSFIIILLINLYIGKAYFLSY